MSQSAPTFFQKPWVTPAAVLVLAAAAVGVYRSNHAARPGSMENIVGLGASLAAGDPKVSAAPACGTGATDGPGCMTALATYMGSVSGFHADKPDQASCAAVAVALVRDHRGDFAPDSNAWLAMLRTGQGAGVDALRMAVATEMARAAPSVGTRADDEAAATKIIAAIAGSVAGACDTYAAIARGEPLDAMAPELHPDHSACVQRDLSRRDGPGGRYGHGVFRAAEGAAALWREEERALRMGAGSASPGAKKLIAEKLAVIEPATQKIALKQVESTEDQLLNTMLGEVHADAGVFLWKTDGGAPDGGAAATPPPSGPRRR